MSDSPITVRAIDHVVLRVGDIDAAIAWYRSVLGGTVERSLPDFGLYQIRVGAALIDLVPTDSKMGRAGGTRPDPAAPNMDHFAVELASFDAAAIRSHLEACGVTPTPVERRYGAKGFGPSMYLKDPDGNTVELKGPPES